MNKPKIVVDADAGILAVGTKLIDLDKEYLKILEHLVAHYGMYRSREEIALAVWGESTWQRYRQIVRALPRISEAVGADRIDAKYGLGVVYDRESLDNPLALVGGLDISGLIILPAAKRLLRHNVEEEQRLGVEVLEDLDIRPQGLVAIEHLMRNAGITVPPQELAAMLWPGKKSWRWNLNNLIGDIHLSIDEPGKPSLLASVGENTTTKFEGYEFIDLDEEAPETGLTALSSQAG